MKNKAKRKGQSRKNGERLSNFLPDCRFENQAFDWQAGS